MKDDAESALFSAVQSMDSHPDELSNGLDQGDPNSGCATDQQPHNSATGTQLGSMGGSWNASSKDPFQAVRQGSILNVDGSSRLATL